VELLTVVSLIAILVGIASPMISAVHRAGGTSSAMNAVGSAIATSEAWARGSRQVYTYSTATPPPVPPVQIEPYQGMAASTNPLRIQTTMRLLQHTDPAASATPGYTNLPQWDPMTLPSGSAIVGITTNNTNGGLELVPPPFAVCFDPSGNVTFGTTTTGTQITEIYADTSANLAGTTYTQIPTVLGVIVYSPLAIMSGIPQTSASYFPVRAPIAYTDAVNGNSSNGGVVGQQILNQGQLIWFSRYSGMMNKVQR
jgi:hypothetical protein